MADPPRRQKGRQLSSDAELDRKKKNGDHERSEDLKNHLNHIAIIALYAVSGVGVLLGLVYLGHLLVAGDWDQLKSVTTHIAVLFVGYGGGWFKSHGITKE